MRAGDLSRAGFTLVEVIMVTAMVSLAARVAAPRVDTALDRARAAAALGDVAVVRQAAHQYLAENHEWPPDTPAGDVPPGLEEYLEGFDFQRETYLLDWELWHLPEGLPSDSTVTSLAAVSIHPDDERLSRALLGSVRDRPGWIALQGVYTFFVED